jgi:hypothetical protein
MANKMNLIGLGAGIAVLLLIPISYLVPWWQFSIGTVAQINLSPVNFSMALFGQTLNQPLVWAMNLAGILTMLTAGIIMIIYSVKPNKSYSKKLLGFSYNKPVFAVIMFVAELLVMYFAVKGLVGIEVPIASSSIIQLPTSMTSGSVTVSVAAGGSFLWPFYFAIAVSGLCIAARLYHKKLVTPLALVPMTPMASVASTETTVPSPAIN